MALPSGILAAAVILAARGNWMRLAAWMGVVLVAGLLTGCAASMDVSGREWAKPNTGPSQVTWDEYQCVWEADGFTRTPDLIVGGLVDLGRYTIEERRREGGFTQCMTSRGYKRVS